MKKIAVLLLGAVLLLPVAAHAQKRRPIWYLRSNPATTCLDALGAGHRCTVNLDLRGQIGFNQTQSTIEGVIRLIGLQSIQNLSWDVNIYSSDRFSRANMDDDPLVDFHSFTSADGKQVSSSAGFGDQYKYSVSGLSIPYRDQDRVRESGTRGSPLDVGPSQVHIEIIPRNTSSTGDKFSGADGAVVVIIGIEPLLD